jgi:hypothetical protein
MNYFARPDQHGRSYTAGLKPQAAYRFVGGALVLFGIAGAMSFALSRTVPWFTILIASALVFHFWPALRPRRPVLTLDAEGLRLDGLGFVLWEAVQDVRVRTARAYGRDLHVMEIVLGAPLSIAVTRPDAAPRWRRFQTRPWSVYAGKVILLDVTNLEDSPREVCDAFAFFLGRPVRGGNGGPRGLVV